MLHKHVRDHDVDINLSFNDIFPNYVTAGSITVLFHFCASNNNHKNCT
jgi:hypothetical protein